MTAWRGTPTLTMLFHGLLSAQATMWWVWWRAGPRHRSMCVVACGSTSQLYFFPLLDSIFSSNGMGNVKSFEHKLQKVISYKF
jgi:hypothetical protein